MSVTVPLSVAVSVFSRLACDPFTVTVCAAAPRASWTFTAFACSGKICTLFNVFFLNPAAVTVRVKLLGGSALKVYTPSADVVAVSVWFVDVSVNVTVAPGITAPLGSVTTP